MGTRIDNLRVLKVTDGDSLRVELRGDSEPLRLVGVDTEESNPGEKPVTTAGHAASQFARQFFATPDGLATVSIEFETDDPVDECLAKYRGTHGRLICVVHRGGDNYNLEAVRQGWSPYFAKYGYSRIYHQDFIEAESEAQAYRRGIWDPETNFGGASREYEVLIPWWHFRAALVDGFRRMPGPALSVRHDYDRIITAADRKGRATVFCDIRRGIGQWFKNGAVIYAGTRLQPFDLYLNDTRTDEGRRLIDLIDLRYADMGRGYVYATGQVTYHDNVPQIVLEHISQLTDQPPA